MLNGNSKQVVIIKNIKSNIIEEAIFILKRPCSEKTKSKTKDKVRLKDSDYIIKEAQDIIDNYTKEYYSAYKDSNIVSTERRKKAVRKRKLSINTLLNISLVIAIATLIFLISRLF